MDRTNDIKLTKQEFRRNGFPDCPLTDEQIVQCLEADVEPYGVGCDVANGWTFAEALEANH